MKRNNINNNKIYNKKIFIFLDNVPPCINNLSDLIYISKKYIHYRGIDTPTLWRITPYLIELNNLVGLESFKKSILHQILYYLQGMHHRSQQEYLHTIITGPPGCGKTTIAKILGKIYSSMNILSKKNVFKIAHRDDFIAGFLGQTAIKTHNLLKSCLGGVLFVDEVYSLVPKGDGKDSFSDEALDTLTSFLSEHKDDFCFIAAGYKDAIMKRLFSKNKGIERRFPWVHNIKPYTNMELAEIFFIMVKEVNWKIIASKQEVADIIKSNKKLFTFEGGDMETYLTKCKIMHSKRVFGLEEEHKFILTKEDLLQGIKYIEKNSKEEENHNLSMYM